MDITSVASKFIKEAFSENKKVKEFKDDFINAFIDWIRPIFLEKDPKLVAALESETQSEKTQGRLETRLEDLLEDKTFKTQLNDWLSKKAINSSEEKNVLNSEELEGNNLIIGDKVPNNQISKRKNIVSIKKGKFTGDIKIGDG